MMPQRRLLLGLVFFLPLFLATCSIPVTVERVDPRSVHRELTANVLTVGEESGASRIVLDRWDLKERFESDPEGALAQLHAAVTGGNAGRDELFALAELSFLHAEQTGKQEYYLAAAVYAYALLFPSGAAEPLYSIDRRLRVAADLYNRGLTSGFASADGSVVELRGGTRSLPFGELTVELDPKWLRWGDRRLVSFVPVAELEVRGLRERYRRTGIGAPLAASTGAFTPDAKLRDFVGRGTKVPVTAFLRLDDPRRCGPLVERRVRSRDHTRGREGRRLPDRSARPRARRARGRAPRDRGPVRRDGSDGIGVRARGARTAPRLPHPRDRARTPAGRHRDRRRPQRAAAPLGGQRVRRTARRL